MSAFEIDGLTSLQADLTAAPWKAQRQAIPAVERSAKRIAEDARRLISGLAHAPHYPASITHDVKLLGVVVTAEIGPDKAKTQGALGNLLEYGSANNAPLAHLGPALDLEGPRFVEALGVAGDL